MKKYFLIALAIAIVGFFIYLIVLSQSSQSQTQQFQTNDPVTLTFIDAETEQVLSNKLFKIHEIFMCEPGEECPTIVSYTGTTDEDGMAVVNRSLILRKLTETSEFEIAIDIILNDESYFGGELQGTDYTKSEFQVLFLRNPQYAIHY